jgi:bacterioferritin
MEPTRGEIMSKDVKKVIEVLNQGRSRELGAILQYMAQHYELENSDFGKLAKVIKTTAIVEMKHAESLAERILFLGGMPTSKPTPEAKKGQKIVEMIATNIGLEEDAIKLYNEAAIVCAAELDHVSKDIFEKLLKDEDAHLDMFQNIKEHLDQLGDVYLATLTGE